MIAGILLGATSLMAEQHDLKTWSGLMVDGGCRDRTPQNLRTPPVDTIPVTGTPDKPPKGIAVAPQIVKAERAEAVLPDTPDHASRYDSASCAITADTKAFAILLDNNQLLDLDEGGNTLAFDAFQSTPAGAAILNGKVGGLKPRATVTGLAAGRRIKTQSVMFVRPSR